MTFEETMPLSLKQARESAGYTQEELARTLGLSWKAVARWESRTKQQTIPPLKTLDFLKKLYELETIDELIY